MKTDARIFLAHLVDDCGYDPYLRDRRGYTNPHFSYCRILDEFDFFDPLPEFIKDSDSSLDECTAVSRWLDAFRVTIEKTHAKRALHIGDRSRDGRLGNRQLRGGPCHASGVCHSEQNAQLILSRFTRRSACITGPIRF